MEFEENQSESMVGQEEEEECSLQMTQPEEESSAEHIINSLLESSQQLIASACDPTLVANFVQNHLQVDMEKLRKILRAKELGELKCIALMLSPAEKAALEEAYTASLQKDYLAVRQHLTTTKRLVVEEEKILVSKRQKKMCMENVPYSEVFVDEYRTVLSRQTVACPTDVEIIVEHKPNTLKPMLQKLYKAACSVSHFDFKIINKLSLADHLQQLRTLLDNAAKEMYKQMVTASDRIAELQHTVRTNPPANIMARCVDCHKAKAYDRIKEIIPAPYFQNGMEIYEAFKCRLEALALEFNCPRNEHTRDDPVEALQRRLRHLNEVVSKFCTKDGVGQKCNDPISALYLRFCELTQCDMTRQNSMESKASSLSFSQPAIPLLQMKTERPQPQPRMYHNMLLKIPVHSLSIFVHVPHSATSLRTMDIFGLIESAEPFDVESLLDNEFVKRLFCLVETAPDAESLQNSNGKFQLQPIAFVTVAFTSKPLAFELLTASVKNKQLTQDVLTFLNTLY